MNYTRPDLLLPLTERFVLGTLSRRPRRRFRRLVDENPEIRTAVYAIEDLLLPMAWSLLPERPSDLVWQRIAREIGRGAKPDVERHKRPALPLLAAAMAFAFVISTLGWWREWSKGPDVVTQTVVETVPLAPAIGVITQDDGEPIWVARIYGDLQRADISVSKLPEPRTDNDYELWILRDDGVPVSLGLLPQSGDRSLALDAAAVDALARGSTLAVSLEPLGGSPEPVPTGAVVYTTVLLAP